MINYDIPQNAEEYIHRIGRTARAGKRGTAVTFVSEWDFDDWERIASSIGSETIERLDLPIYGAAAERLPLAEGVTA